MKKISIFIVVLILCGTVLPSMLFAGAQQEENPEIFNFGFLSSLSGTFAGVAATQEKSFVLAVEQVNARGGLDMPWGKVKVEYDVKDDEAKLDVGVRRFREMSEKGLHALTGGIWNPMSAALNEECKLNPTIYVPGYVPSKDSYKKGNPAACTFTPTFTPWSIGYIAGQSVIQSLGKKTIFYLGRADSWGTTIQEGLEAACEKYGGEIVGVAETPMGTMDYTPIINKVLALKPDVFITSMFGGDAIANLKQAYDLGLYDVCTIFNTWTANIVAKGIPDQALEGSYALAWFYYDLEGFKDAEIVKSVKEYSDAYMARWNEPPDNMGTAAYVAATTVFQAVEKAGSFDPGEVAEALMTGKFDTVKGPSHFREDHQAVADHSTFLLKGKSPGEKKNKWDFFQVIDSFGGEEVLPPLSVMGF